MAVKRHCENKSYLKAKGSSLRFIGAARDDRKDMLMRAFNFPLHVCVVGDDIVSYYQEDWYKDDLRFMRENFSKQLGSLLLPQNISKRTNVVLANVLPERLPMQDNKTWQQIYERSIESTTRDDSGKSYTTRVSSLRGDESDEPAIVRTLSVNEYRTNGHF